MCEGADAHAARATKGKGRASSLRPPACFLARGRLCGAARGARARAHALGAPNWPFWRVSNHEVRLGRASTREGTNFCFLFYPLLLGRQEARGCGAPRCAPRALDMCRQRLYASLRRFARGVRACGSYSVGASRKGWCEGSVRALSLWLWALLGGMRRALRGLIAPPWTRVRRESVSLGFCVTRAPEPINGVQTSEMTRGATSGK